VWSSFLQKRRDPIRIHNSIKEMIFVCVSPPPGLRCYNKATGFCDMMKFLPPFYDQTPIRRWHFHNQAGPRSLCSKSNQPLEDIKREKQKRKVQTATRYDKYPRPWSDAKRHLPLPETYTVLGVMTGSGDSRVVIREWYRTVIKVKPSQSHCEHSD
jgi:hypothetical protein